MAKAPFLISGGAGPLAAISKAAATGAGEVIAFPIARVRREYVPGGDPAPPPPTVRHAIAVLEAYEAHVRTLMASWRDLQLYAGVRDEVDAIRRCCAGVPHMSVPWVMLLIAHAELIHSLWHSARAGSTVTAADREQHLEHVLAAARELKRRWLLRLEG